MHFKPLTAEEYASRKQIADMISIDLGGRPPLTQVNLSQSPYSVWSRSPAQTQPDQEMVNDNKESTGLKR